MERGIERQPDPTGALEMRQIFLLCPGYGTIVTTGVRWGVSDISIPGVSLTNAGKRLIQGQYGGTGLMRDVPRMINMMERGQYKWERIVSAQYPLEQARQALEDAAYRTKISAHVVFDPAQFV
jgi:Zn-dependent alcohol dehydrogenase